MLASMQCLQNALYYTGLKIFDQLLTAGKDTCATLQKNT
jgi:hypothetical protein